MPTKLLNQIPQWLGKKTQPSGQTPKIYFSISSEGLGHASRAIALASPFPANEVLIGTYGYALERIRLANLPTVEVMQEYRMIGEQGRVDVGKTIFENQASLINLTQMVSEERQVIEESGATLVVADGRIAPVLAASRLGVPCLVVTNQSNFYSFFQCQESPLVKLFGKSFEWWLGRCLLLADEILIPDFSPPDTVCLYNLSNNVHIKKQTRFTGPLVGFKADEVVPITKPEGYTHYVVVSLGGHAYRKPLLDLVLKTAPQFPHIYFELLTSLEVVPLSNNVGCRGQVLESAPFFKAADCVITQAGHSTAMELLTLGIPSLVVPDENQSEQTNNAFQLEALGVSARLTYEHLAKKPAILAHKLDQILKTPRYKQAALGFAEKAKAQQMQQPAKTLLQEYAQRLIAY